jgi:hypothetical protein
MGLPRCKHGSTNIRDILAMYFMNMFISSRAHLLFCVSHDSSYGYELTSPESFPFSLRIEMAMILAKGTTTMAINLTWSDISYPQLINHDITLLSLNRMMERKQCRY